MLKGLVAEHQLASFIYILSEAQSSKPKLGDNSSEAKAQKFVQLPDKRASQAFLEKNMFSKLNDVQSLAKDFNMKKSKRAIRQNNNLEDWA